ncbi:AP-2 complex subunit alpha [Entomortierella parvispora]|uniref:AP-2 complex subunit alpha n=1 Tax=Entomortierella parvispora TaxID=205924 RepID=A0A9P3HAH1_9FUNG|nr:AP-2 complex subunit alpha [Entomortierella parvispora]
MSMRGLTVFIADIRNCRVRELEEKRINKEMANIRTKFKEGSLSGYDKKKYVCKLLYMYILGWDIDFGHMEAVGLISSTKYSEKQIGYLGITLLMHENSDLVRLVVNSIRKDLEDNNEIHNCLALHAIANIGGREMAESLAGDVHRLLVSPNSKSFVKKKAALTMLRLFRKHPDVIPAPDWAERITNIIDDYDLGVCLSVTSLVTALAQQYPESFMMAIPKAIMRLHKVIVERDFSADYVYYKIPIPWLQVKLLRLLQYFPPTEDPNMAEMLHNVLQTIINNSLETPRNVQHNNAQNAILFEAINLAIHLDCESDIVRQATTILARFILSKETNVRYLGLETMAHLAAVTDELDEIKKHEETIILSLRDKDISVRRRGLDLLYSMCDVSNAKTIVSELIRYLHIADYALREEMVLKIAIMTEKYATEHSWYVDVILQLISSAGDHVGEEVWYRVVQIVTNHENLQEYSAKMVLHYMRSPHCHENMLKVGGYILGEYGHLIANLPGCSPIEQFNTLHARFGLCSLATRALLLSTYIKFVNLFPEIKGAILAVFNQYRHVLDAELQQRACEYMAIATMPTDDLLQTVCEEMPQFPERESALLSRLNEKTGQTEDKRTWNIGGKDSNEKTPANLLAAKERNENGSVDDLVAGVSNASLGTTAGGEGEDGSAASAANGGASSTPAASSAASASSKPAGLSWKDQLAPGSEKWYNRLRDGSDGVLYEDSILQIGIKSEYHGHLGRLAMYFGNKTHTQLGSFTVTVDSPEGLVVASSHTLATSIGPSTQIQQLYSLECQQIVTEVPMIRISYHAGSTQSIYLRLPVTLTRFIEPIQLSSADFFARWKQIGGPPREVQEVIKVAPDRIDLEKARSILVNNRLGICENVDPKPGNFVATGVFNTSMSGKVGCLLRLEPNKETDMYRLTVRTTSDVVSKHLKEILQTALLYNPNHTR